MLTYEEFKKLQYLRVRILGIVGFYTKVYKTNLDKNQIDKLTKHIFTQMTKERNTTEILDGIMQGYLRCLADTTPEDFEKWVEQIYEFPQSR